MVFAVAVDDDPCRPGQPLRFARSQRRPPEPCSPSRRTSRYAPVKSWPASSRYPRI